MSHVHVHMHGSCCCLVTTFLARLSAGWQPTIVVDCSSGCGSERAAYYTHIVDLVRQIYVNAMHGAAGSWLIMHGGGGGGGG